ncbi:MAG: response regulator transcription factor [Deltaproteobacteria bacterium]|nr:response regulator transcription factor [Deltaproteobacteria bacterium]
MVTVTEKTKVLIVDDHPIVRHGLAQLINQEDDMVACGEAEDVADALEVVSALRPDIVLIDVALKSSNGMDLIEPVKERFAEIPVLMLSMHDEVVYAERALRAGAQGYIMKQDPPEKVIEAIRQVLGGEIYLSESMTGKMLKRLATGQTAKEVSPLERLSAREIEIFRLIGQGRDTRQIAEKLEISKKTIDAHRANIKKKLEIKRGTELVQMAIKWVLTEENG